MKSASSSEYPSWQFQCAAVVSMDVDIQLQLFLSCLDHGVLVVPISIRRAFGFELVNAGGIVMLALPIALMRDPLSTPPA